MSSPVMSRNPYFKKTAVRPNQFQSQPQPQGSYQNPQGFAGYDQAYQGQYVPPAYQQQAYAGSYGAFQPAAPQARSGLMTYRDAMNKTGILLGVTVLSGIATSILLGANPGLMLSVAMIASIAAFVVGLVIAFKRMIAPGLAIAYAVLEGVALGGLTAALNLFWPGVAMEAVLGTVIVVGVTLGLHYSGKVSTTPKGMKFVMIVALAGIIFGFLNMFISIFTQSNPLWNNPLLGIGLGVVMILVAAYMLINDFENVQYAVANGAPAEFSWTCATAIVMTILWIYVEVLRIAAIIADNQ